MPFVEELQRRLHNHFERYVSMIESGGHMQHPIFHYKLQEVFIGSLNDVQAGIDNCPLITISRPDDVQILHLDSLTPPTHTHKGSTTPWRTRARRPTS